MSTGVSLAAQALPLPQANRLSRSRRMVLWDHQALHSCFPAFSRNAVAPGRCLSAEVNV